MNASLIRSALRVKTWALRNSTSPAFYSARLCHIMNYPKIDAFSPHSAILQTTSRCFSVSIVRDADKKSTLKKPFTPKGKFDLEDDANKRELDQIREELKQKEELEKKQEAREEEVVYGELLNEMTRE